MSGAERSLLVVNPRAGRRPGRVVERLERAARAAGVQVVRAGAGDDLAELAETAVRRRRPTALGVAGGDGSVSAVAGVALRHGLPLVCVPTGTRNHFARDLGLDRRRPLRALAGFTGAPRRVDVGQVNGRVFLDNVAFGVYADLVATPIYRRSKVLAAVRVLTRRPEERPDPVLDGPGRRVVFVGNNAYRWQARRFGVSRPRLDAGALSVVTVPTAGRRRGGPAELVALARVVQGLPGAQLATGQLRASTAAPVPAAVDGELVKLGPQIEFTCRPGALTVLVGPR